MIEKLTDMNNKVSSGTAWRDYDQISENFDLALSPEVIGWFHQQHDGAAAHGKNDERSGFDEYELSLM